MKTAYEIAWDLVNHSFTSSNFFSESDVKRIEEITGVDQKTLKYMILKYRVRTEFSKAIWSNSKENEALFFKELSEEIENGRPHYPQELTHE